MLLFYQPSFLGRTVLSNRKYGNEAFQSFNKQRWQKINAEINWVEETNMLWASLGSSNAREHLLFDENIPIIDDLKTYATEYCEQFKGDISAILASVNELVNSLTSQPGLSRQEVESGLDQRLTDYINDKKRLMNSINAPIITMDELIQNKLLVCRHKGPLVACILAELVRKNILPQGSVRQYRSQIQHGTHIGVHTWAVYRDKQSNNLWMCDPRWDYVQNVTCGSMAAAAKGYGTKAIHKMQQRLDLLDHAEFERLKSIQQSPDIQDTSFDEEYDHDVDGNLENQAEVLLNTLRQQQHAKPIAAPVITALPVETEYQLDFLNDNLHEAYYLIENENAPIRHFMKNIGKMMSNKRERRFQIINQLESLFLEMHNNHQLSNFEKALNIYACFHRTQLMVRGEHNRFQSSLDVLCSAYKRKILNLYKNDVNKMFRFYEVEGLRTDNLFVDPTTQRQVCRM